jgi:hypothetical protein
LREIQQLIQHTESRHPDDFLRPEPIGGDIDRTFQIAGAAGPAASDISPAFGLDSPTGSGLVVNDPSHVFISGG